MWRMPITWPRPSMTGKCVKPERNSLSRVSGPRMSVRSTKVSAARGVIRSATMRSSRLITAEMRARSVIDRTDVGVRRMRRTNSAVVDGA